MLPKYYILIGEKEKIFGRVAEKCISLYSKNKEKKIFRFLR